MCVYDVPIVPVHLLHSIYIYTYTRTRDMVVMLITAHVYPRYNNIIYTVFFFFYCLTAESPRRILHVGVYTLFLFFFHPKRVHNILF